MKGERGWEVSHLIHCRHSHSRDEYQDERETKWRKSAAYEEYRGCI